MSQGSEINSLWKVWDTSLKVSYDKQNDSINISTDTQCKLDGTEYTIRGFSIAALRTNFIIKELNIIRWIIRKYVSRPYIRNPLSF